MRDYANRYRNEKQPPLQRKISRRAIREEEDTANAADHLREQRRQVGKIREKAVNEKLEPSKGKWVHDRIGSIACSVCGQRESGNSLPKTLRCACDNPVALLNSVHRSTNTRRSFLATLAALFLPRRRFPAFGGNAFYTKFSIRKTDKNGKITVIPISNEEGWKRLNGTFIQADAFKRIKAMQEFRDALNDEIRTVRTRYFEECNTGMSFKTAQAVLRNGIARKSPQKNLGLCS